MSVTSFEKNLVGKSRFWIINPAYVQELFDEKAYNTGNNERDC